MHGTTEPESGSAEVAHGERQRLEGSSTPNLRVEKSFLASELRFLSRKPVVRNRRIRARSIISKFRHICHHGQHGEPELPPRARSCSAPAVNGSNRHRDQRPPIKVRVGRGRRLVGTEPLEHRVHAPISCRHPAKGHSFAHRMKGMSTTKGMRFIWQPCTLYRDSRRERDESGRPSICPGRVLNEKRTNKNRGLISLARVRGQPPASFSFFS